MTDVDCAWWQDNGDELTLGLLRGNAQISARQHLEHCTACRDASSRLGYLRQQLLELIPEVEPPVGFDACMMQHLQSTKPRSHSRIRLAAVAVVTILLVATVSWSVGVETATHHTAADASLNELSETSFMTSNGQQVGKLYVYNDEKPWAFMTVAIDGFDGPLTCLLQQRNASPVRVGTFQVTNGVGYWAVPVTVNVSLLTSVELLQGDGSSIAIAHL